MTEDLLEHEDVICNYEEDSGLCNSREILSDVAVGLPFGSTDLKTSVKTTSR